MTFTFALRKSNISPSTYSKQQAPCRHWKDRNSRANHMAGERRTVGQIQTSATQRGDTEKTSQSAYLIHEQRG
jgi:hypothetical protein